MKKCFAVYAHGAQAVKAAAWNVAGWMLDKAREHSTDELKNWIWNEAKNGQPIPGNISVEACRVVLLERGEDGKGYRGS